MIPGKVDQTESTSPQTAYEFEVIDGDFAPDSNREDRFKAVVLSM